MRSKAWLTEFACRARHGQPRRPLCLATTLARTLGSALKTRQALTLENLALRHQLAVLQRSARRPQMRRWDQLLWVLLRQLWADWSNALVLVRPATVVRWHRAGSHDTGVAAQPGRPADPPVGSEIRALIRRMAKANPLWGAPRIHGEFLQLGIHVSERTVSRCMPSPAQLADAKRDTRLQRARGLACCGTRFLARDTGGWGRSARLNLFLFSACDRSRERPSEQR